MSLSDTWGNSEYIWLMTQFTRARTNWLHKLREPLVSYMHHPKCHDTSGKFSSVPVIKFKISLENGGCDDKEKGQRATISAYVFLFTRLLILLANYKHMGFVEEGSVVYFKEKFVFLQFVVVVSNLLESWLF